MRLGRFLAWPVYDFWRATVHDDGPEIWRAICTDPSLWSVACFCLGRVDRAEGAGLAGLCGNRFFVQRTAKFDHTLRGGKIRTAEDYGASFARRP